MTAAYVAMVVEAAVIVVQAIHLRAANRRLAAAHRTAVGVKKMVDGVLVRGDVHHCRPPRAIDPEAGGDSLLIAGHEIEAGDGYVCAECDATWSAVADSPFMHWMKDVPPPPAAQPPRGH